MVLIELVGLAALASLAVSLWTVRVALTARGHRIAGSLVASLEAVTFATSFAQVLDSLDSPARVFAYAVGVAAGTLAGLSADRVISERQRWISDDDVHVGETACQ